MVPRSAYQWFFSAARSTLYTFWSWDCQHTRWNTLVLALSLLTHESKHQIYIFDYWKRHFTSCRTFTDAILKKQKKSYIRKRTRFSWKFHSQWKSEVLAARNPLYDLKTRQFITVLNRIWYYGKSSSGIAYRHFTEVIKWKSEIFPAILLRHVSQILKFQCYQTTNLNQSKKT